MWQTLWNGLDGAVLGGLFALLLALVSSAVQCARVLVRQGRRHAV